MDAVLEPQAVKPAKKRQTRINYALAGVLIGQGVTLAEAALQTGAANANTLRAGLARKGVTATKVRPKPQSANVTATLTAKVVTEATEIIRERTNGVLFQQVNKLANKPVGKLANRGQGEAAVLETLSRTWRNLNGNPDSVTFNFGASSMAEVRPPGTPNTQALAGPVIDCPPVQDSPCVFRLHVSFFGCGFEG